MDYYPSSGSRGRSSYRGGGRGDSYRGSRGYSRGSGASRGRGGSSYKYEGSSKYGVGESKYHGGSSYDDYDRRSDSAYSSSRDRRSDLPPRKREREPAYSSQASSRRHEDDYRGSGRYSGEHYEYEERSFKKPRTVAPQRDGPRSTRPRGAGRGGPPRRGRGEYTASARKPSSSYSSRVIATTSEILAIRRAKQLQIRLKEEAKEKAAKKETEKKEAEKTKGEKTEESGEKGAEAEAAGDDKDKEKAAKPKDEERTTYYGRPFVKLLCPTCDTKCVTFKEYVAHLYDTKHTQAIKEKTDELKANLAAMRIAQREQQKKADEEDLTTMSASFCAICKLNYSQDRDVHQESDLHKKLKEFLMPYCKVCRIQYQSPMRYEDHICSLEHLKRKHDHEEREKKTAAAGLPDKFMVLDSVGSGDEGEEKEAEEGAAKKEKTGAKEEAAEETVENEEDLILGLEFIHEIKAKYCEVCRHFLPRLRSAADNEQALSHHCRTKEHLRCYLHYGHDSLLEKMKAEASGDFSASDKHEEEPASDSLTAEEKELGLGDVELESEEGLDAEGDKLWDGLTELLDEAQHKSDDEDEEEGGRFDRFKSNEKKENGDLSLEEATKKNGDEAESTETN